MKCNCIPAILLSAAFLAPGCNQAPLAATIDPDPPIPGYPTEAQLKLDTIKLWAGAEDAFRPLMQ